MHPTVFDVFEEICHGRVPVKARVLEVGVGSTEDSLLRLPSLEDAELRVGVDLEVAAPARGTQFVRVGADGLAAFADGTFDVVLCNSVLEHDPHFWRTVQGIHRVARQDALIVIGVPGYADLRPSALSRATRILARIPAAGVLFERIAPGWSVSTPTLVVHNYPGDYYRFSVQAMRHVLLSGCARVETQVIMRPPRIIGFGWKTASRE
jgi:SAM-dependent methyltransferase